MSQFSALALAGASFHTMGSTQTASDDAGSGKSIGVDSSVKAPSPTPQDAWVG